MGSSKVDYCIVCHHGIVVETEEGNSWLIHNGNNMSNQWRKVNDINVSWDVEHIVGGCLCAGGTWCKDAFDNSNPVKQYLASGLCVGTAKKIESHLSLTNEQILMSENGEDFLFDRRIGLLL